MFIYDKRYERAADTGTQAREQEQEERRGEETVKEQCLFV